MTERRLVAVLGYSKRGGAELHPVSAERLARAAAEALETDAVLLTGAASEAELMERAWSGAAERVLVDPTARSTYGNAVAAAAAARELPATEVVVVTSGWHARRASALVRAALHGSGPRVTLAATDERGTVAARIRELACWTLVPVQAALAARRR